MRRPFHLAVLSCAMALLMVAGCADLKNPVPNPLAPSPLVHPAGWADSTNAGDPTLFHGTFLKQEQPQWDLSGCQSCHGGTFLGGSSGVSCFPCHDPYPHGARFVPTPVSGHVAYMRTRAYQYNDCKPCHGADYFGGGPNQTQVSCGQCHRTTNNTPKSPEACNTCHGRFRGEPNDTLSWAPPNALNNDTLTTSRGVGAHQLHLRGTGFTSSASVACGGCHNVPGSVFAAGHVDSQPPAEVVLSSALASTPSGGARPAPSYDPATLKCSNTYCHGAWKLRRSNPLTYNTFYTDSTMTGSFAAPRWNGGSSEAACGSCHGLPPKGHITATLGQCYGCHAGVVDISGQIIDKTKHINGKANVFGQELDFK